MRELLFGTWPRRLAWVVAGTAISVSWLPTWIFARGQAKHYGLVEGMDCYMEPEFFRDNGVSAHQVCLEYQVNIGTLLIYMLLSASVVCTSLAAITAADWISGPAQDPPPVVDTPSEPAVPNLPEYGRVPYETVVANGHP